MYPKLMSSDGQQLAILDNIIKDSARIKRVVNGEFTFSFEAVEKELKSEYFNPDNNLVVGGQTFDIKYTEQTHDVGIVYRIECEHANYRLRDGEDNIFPSYAFTGTPAQILTNILTGTEFNVGTVDYTDEVIVLVNEEITRKDLIYQLANLLGGEIEYTNLGFTINLLNSIGHDNGFEIRLGKNLKGITKTVDSRGGLKTYYNVNIVELKNSNEYIKKGLQDLEVIEVGDTVRVIDELMGINVVNRILSIEYNPIFAMNTSLEIANTIELITDKINQIETQSIKRADIIYGVRINSDVGLEIERKDKLGRTILNADEFRMQKGNGIGGYTDSLYFDAINQRYIFTGRLEASEVVGGTIEGSTITGGNINGTNINGGTINIGASNAIEITSSGGLGLLKIGATSMQASGSFVAWNGSGLGLNFSTLMKNGQDIATLSDIPSISGASGSFTTADGKTVTVSNGLVTSIM